MTIILNGTTGITTPGITNQGVVEFTAGSVSAPSITTTGDTNTGIYFPAADTIAFTEGGVESMRINSSGNVGIGTASPTTRLDVNVGGTSNIKLGTASNFGIISLNGSVTTSASMGIFGGATGDVDLYYQNATSGGHRFRVGTTTMAYLDSSGNLGIGTASPATRLDVAGTVTARNSSNQLLAYSAVNTNQSYAIYLDQDNAGSKSWSLFDATASQTAIRYYPGASGFWQFYTNNTERMRLDSSGNLGIGTTSPGSILEIKTTTPLITLSASAYTNQYQTTLGAKSGAEAYLIFGNNGLNEIRAGRTNTGGYLDFYTNNTVAQASASDGNFVMRMASTGNLGIGTTSPGAKLEVYVTRTSATNAVALILNDNVTGAQTDGVYKAIRSLSNGGASISEIRFVETGGTNNDTGVAFATQSTAGALTERMRINQTGVLLVGTTTVGGQQGFSVSPNASAGAAQVIFDRANTASNSAIFLFKNAGTQVGFIQYNNTTTQYGTSSDRRLKDNIAPADNAGSVIDAIEVVKHDWKVGGHTRYGMIAQDLHMVAPEAVSVGDDGEELKTPWGVDYSKLVPMLVKEVQSLRKRVAELESK